MTSMATALIQWVTRTMTGWMARGLVGILARNGGHDAISEDGLLTLTLSPF
jgi:hypothetical protein